MRACVIDELRAPPSVREVPRPEPAPGETTIRVGAAPVNPVDLSIAAGLFYGARSELPYVPGVECAGTVIRSDALPEGTPIWAFGAGTGITRPGTLAEEVNVPDATVFELPDGRDVAIAATLGIPAVTGWLAVRARAGLSAGESVLVLGGSGSVGLAAIQAARDGGAAHIVAAGRNAAALQRCREAGADATAVLDGDADSMASALAEACGHAPPQVVVDPLCGSPLEAAATVAASDARIVQLGQSAGPSAQLKSGDIRGKGLNLLGLSIFRAGRADIAEALSAMLALVARGEWSAPYERLALEELGTAWPDLDPRGSGRRILAAPVEEAQNGR